MPPADPAAKLKGKIEELKQCLFARDGERLGIIYSEIIRADPQFTMRGPVQFDLARALEEAGDDELALQAFRLLVEKQPDNPSRAASLRSAGLIANRLHRQRECAAYLVEFLATRPPASEKREVEAILADLPASLRRQAEEALERRKTPQPERAPAKKPDSAVYVEFEVGTEQNTENPKRKAADWQKAPRRPVMDSEPSGFVPMPSPGKAAAGKPPASIDESAIVLEEDRFPSKPLPPPPARSPKHLGDRPSAMHHEPARHADKQDHQRTSPSRKLEPPRPAVPITPPPDDIHDAPTPLDSARASVPARKPSPPAEIPRAHGGVGLPPVRPSPGEGGPMQQPPPPKAVPPSTPPAGAAHRETPEERYDRLRDARFAMLLPLGKKIHLDEVARFVSEVEQLTEVDAKKAVLYRKGLLYDNLSMDEVLDLHAKSRVFRQTFLVVAVPARLRPTASIEVLSASLHDKGIKLASEHRQEKLRWNEVKLVNCGCMAGTWFATVTGGEPLREFRFVERVFEVEEFLPGAPADFHAALPQLLKALSDPAAQSVLGQTARAVSEGRTPTPPQFADAREFHFYTLWSLFAAFGEPVSPEELAEVARVASNW